MTQETKAMWQRVLAHQLKGIMFHQEASLIYRLLYGYRHKSAIRHCRRYLDESLTHYQTMEHIIQEYGEIVHPLPNTVIPLKVSDVTTRPAEKADCMKVMQEINATWKAWEKSTVELYEEAMEAIPNCKWLKSLKCGAEKELKSIG